MSRYGLDLRVAVVRETITDGLPVQAETFTATSSSTMY